MVNEFDINGIMDVFGFGMEMFAVIAAIVAVLALIGSIVGIACYVFQSIGLYQIAASRGIKRPWLAWLPVGYYWIAGSISDQYQYVAKGRVKNNRVIMLVLSLATAAIGIVAATISGNALSEIVGSLLFSAEETNWESLMAEIGLSAGASSALSLLEDGVSVALFVFWNISLYNLYCSCNPKNATLFTVLGILFPVTVPFFVFACRKKEQGMPPRKVSYAACPQPEEADWQPVQPTHEPWGNPEE